VLGLLLFSAVARAGPPAPPTFEESASAWNFVASLSWYFVPDQKNFGVLDLTADVTPRGFTAGTQFSKAAPAFGPGLRHAAASLAFPPGIEGN
jgi:hypothetical protein